MALRPSGSKKVVPFKLNVGTGADGAWASAGTAQTYYLDDLPGGFKQEYNLTTFWLKATDILYLRKRVDDGTRNKPTIIRATVSITVDGTINGDGLGYPGGTAQFQIASESGQGPGKGGGGCDAPGAGGSCSTVGGAGTSNWPGMLGATYDPLAALLTGDWKGMGAGSGGGKGGTPWNGYVGGDGGKGGAGLYMITPYFKPGLTALIYLRGNGGGNGSSDGTYYGFAGGGGSGGIFVAVFDHGDFPASGTQVVATGGLGGTTPAPSGVKAGDGGLGYSALIYITAISPDEATAKARCNPVATVLNLRTLPRTLG